MPRCTFSALRLSGWAQNTEQITLLERMVFPEAWCRDPRHRKSTDSHGSYSDSAGSEADPDDNVHLRTELKKPGPRSVLLASASHAEEIFSCASEVRCEARRHGDRDGRVAVRQRCLAPGAALLYRAARVGVS